MKRASPEIDLSILNGEAKRELIDFYQFLITKYKTRSVKRKKFKSLIENPLKATNIIIPTREELYERNSIY